MEDQNHKTTGAVDVDANANYARLHQLVHTYSSNLQEPSEKLLKISVDRLIQTLAPQNVDMDQRSAAASVLQRVYEEVLMNPEKTAQQKTVETMLAGTRWTTVGALRPIENRSPVAVTVANVNAEALRKEDVTSIVEGLARQRYQETSHREYTETELDRSPTSKTRTRETSFASSRREDADVINEIVRVTFMENTRFEPRLDPPRQQVARGAQPVAPAPAARNTPSPPLPPTQPEPQPVRHGDIHWIDLHKPDPSSSFGFSIGGGIGNEFSPGDYGIYVTKINEGSVAWQDGRLGVGDKLLCVRTVAKGSGEEAEISMDNKSHEDAVNVLRRAGVTVWLLVQHLEHSGRNGSPPAEGYTPSSSQLASGGLRQFAQPPRKRKSDNSLCCC